MSLTEDPTPLGDTAFLEYTWPVVSSKVFEVGEVAPTRTLADVIEHRRSNRVLAPASLEQTVGALLFALRPRFWKEGDSLKRSRRPSLSAGALHPITVLLFQERAVFRLNAELSLLERLQFSDEVYSAWVSKCQSVLPEANGTFLMLVADMARPNSAYANSESLVWRDAGALLQTIALVAELFGLGFCPLGILGHEVVTELHSDGQLLAVGAAVIGLRPEARAADSNQ
ncbi:hypothetical protein [Janthinobacterium sp. ROICE36]|uniref:hypothetical protein n=1 Tax=Janthinobacterium sp. ROICE36 TaxID=2048670 RepID=UPI0011AF199C|nr:hypothetical protein [Janthinobacterium sp. ROICE36]